MGAVPRGPGALVLGEFQLSGGSWFPWHVHDHHQLAWASSGVAVVNVAEAHWVLPPSRALWLPAGTVHRTGASGRTALRGVYVDPGRCPVSWARPQMLTISSLLRELLEYLTSAEVGDDARRRAEAVVFDVLEPVAVTPISVPMPDDPRARLVAEALIADPADPRSLAAFGRAVGASERTLARVFLAECRLSFGRWRTQARLRAALPLLADGMPMDGVARRVGYSSSSAFVAAFRRAVGVPPGQYFAGVG
ncbi:MAG: helix-turn-helix domain-containing protein [Pseudonocardiaceae bacterium]|nr:helix-turn-helix domain-containing protein [Pseudonocardiaceae bacterium]